MQCPRHQLFTGTGLAIDQYGDVGMAEPTNSAKHLLHGRCFTDNLSGLFLHRGRLFTAGFFPVLDGAAHQRYRLIHIKRLGQVLKGPALVGGHRRIQIGMGGHDDHRQVRILALQDLEHAQAISTGHSHVTDQHLRLLRSLFQGIQRLIAIFETGYRVSFLAQCLFQHPANGAVIVDYPYGYAHDRPLPGFSLLSLLTAT